MRILDRTRLAGAGLALWLLLPGAGAATGASGPDTLRVIFTPDVFSSVNRNDALASGKAWIESVGRRRGINLLVEVDTYASAEDLRRRVRDRSADLFILSSLHYLDLGAEQAALDAVFMPQRGDVVLEEYLLLTRRDRRMTLPDLRGKPVLFLKASGANLSRLWFAALLKENGLGSLDSFSPAAEDADKSSTAILPVFFGKADACVVDASSFRLMKELNPQLGEALEVCRSSPRYLETVVCMHHDYTKERANVLGGLADLDKDVAGRQIFMVFKIDRLVPFEDKALETVRELRTTGRRVQGVTSR